MGLGIGLVLLVVLVIILVLALSGGDDTTTSSSTSSTTSLPLESSSYAAELTGDQAVPPVNTQASASFKMEYISSSKELSWSLEITKALSSPTRADIYEGNEGEAGSIVYTLWVAEAGEEGSKVGVLAEGVVNVDDLVGPLQGGTLADLIQLIRDGKAYVCIANKTHPEAIRGVVSVSQ